MENQILGTAIPNPEQSLENDSNRILQALMDDGYYVLKQATDPTLKSEHQMLKNKVRLYSELVLEDLH